MVARVQEKLTRARRGGDHEQSPEREHRRMALVHVLEPHVAVRRAANLAAKLRRNVQQSLLAFWMDARRATVADVA